MSNKTSYPDQARFVARVAAELGYTFTDLDDGNGYLFRVSNGRRHFISGAGWICTYPINSASAYEVTRDKRHTNSVLLHAGLPVIPSELFFITDYHAALRSPGRELSDAVKAFEGFSGPVFCKPNAGSRGDFAEIINDLGAFHDYIDRVRERYDTILLQPIFDGDEYRIFCVDDEVFFAIQKASIAVVGDGHRSLQQLLIDENDKLKGTGVSAVSVANTLNYLATAKGVAAGSVLKVGERVTLPGRRNLSAGSDVLEFTTNVPPQLAELALKAAQAIGIRVSGVDIFDVSPRRDLSMLVVIEVNGNPAISSLGRMGRDDVVDRIWRKVLHSFFED